MRVQCTYEVTSDYLLLQILTLTSLCSLHKDEVYRSGQRHYLCRDHQLDAEIGTIVRPPTVRILQSFLYLPTIFPLILRGDLNFSAS
jgi:hypothetical protein